MEYCKDLSWDKSYLIYQWAAEVLEYTLEKFTGDTK